MDLGQIMDFVQGLGLRQAAKPAGPPSSATAILDPLEAARVFNGVGQATARATADQAQQDQYHSEAQDIISERADSAWADFKNRLSGGYQLQGGVQVPAATTPMPAANGLRSRINSARVPRPAGAMDAGEVPPMTIGGIRS